jgi:DNA-binding GntR family transcriptional regulator
LPASSAPAIASQPQYALVAQRIIEDIASGRYAVGSLLPGEHDLCTQFGVSRHTIREAIRRLQERGLVTRHRGIGTTVRAAEPETRYVQSGTSIADLPRYVEDTRLVTTEASDVIAEGDLAEQLRCPEGQRWVRVRGFRYAGKQKLPIALSDIYVAAPFGGIRNLIGTMKVPVYALIEKQFGVTIARVTQEIGATIIGPAQAAPLKVKAGSAGLVVTRRYLDANDRPIEVAVNLHPADRFSYSMSLRLQVPADGDA